MSRCIVALGEGHADCDSLPTLLSRIARSLNLETPVLPEPIRFPRNRILKTEELPRLLGLARKKLRRPGGILVLLDADDDCPALLGPRVLASASELCADVPVSVVLAKRMFESWLVAGAEGLVENGEIHPGETPDDPEVSVRSPKEWLSRRIRRSEDHGEMADQKRLTGCFSLTEARRRSASFDKLYREVERLLGGT